MSIRAADSTDRDRMIEFFEFAHSERAPARTIDRILEFGACFLAEVQGAVVGYATLEYTFFERGFLSMLYVSEPYRRTGLGRSLVESVASQCATPLLFTSTNTSNSAMRALLSSLNYRPCGSVSELDPGDPELFFVREARVGAV